MRSSDNKPFVYEKQQLMETICQLRFPTILSIDAKEPADFQDLIRADFPRYACQMDTVPGPDGKKQQIRNHSFITEDGTFKISRPHAGRAPGSVHPGLQARVFHAHRPSLSQRLLP